MPEITQIRLSGFGGQGIVLAGLLLSIAGVEEGLEVANSNSYGAQARGSACKAEVIFGKKAIVFPHVLMADYLIAMSQGAYDLFLSDISPDGIVIYDRFNVSPDRASPCLHFGIDATGNAIKQLGGPQSANIIMLGAFSAVTGLVSPESLKKSVEKNAPSRFQETNLTALKTGLELGENIKKGREV
jgi:2-oxoglutarate ferredoxin oxidoreductase subunit gamma